MGNNTVSSGNYGDTAKDKVKNLNSPLSYRVVLLSKQLKTIKKQLELIIMGL